MSFRSWASSIALALLVCFIMAPRSASALELPDLAARIKPSVVHLKVLDRSGKQVGTGTGFFIDGSRVVTNRHVIAAAAKMTATLTDGRELEVKGVLALNLTKDIAIIEVVGSELPPGLDLGSSKGLRQGDEVVVIGSPRGLAGTLSTGIVSALRGDGIDAGDDGAIGSWAIQITAAIAPGSSGSPIMTRDGKVVAVAVGIIRGEGNLNFGIPIEVLKEMLATLSPTAKSKPFDTMIEETSGGVGFNLLISVVFFVLIALAFVVPGQIKKRRAR